jgi:hypothetical protein
MTFGVDDGVAVGRTLGVGETLGVIVTAGVTVGATVDVGVGLVIIREMLMVTGLPPEGVITT